MCGLGLSFVVFLFSVTSVKSMGYIEEPSSSSVTIGDDITLRCTVSNKGDSRLYWQKLEEAAYKYISMDRHIDPYGISPDITSRYSVTGDEERGEYNLRIEKVNVNDAGPYACVYFDQGFGRYSQISNLTVMWPAPEPPQCQFTYSSSSQRVSLICTSRGGQPLASLGWKNGRHKLKSTTRNTNDVALNIYQPGSQKFMESTFTCVANTPALTTPRVCKVLPVYIDWRRNKLYAGDNVILTCTVFGNEHNLEISWQINGQIVTNSGKLTEFRDAKRKLIIYNLDMSDNGKKVTCVVQNRNGLRGNGSETLMVNRKETVVVEPTHLTTKFSSLTPTLNNNVNELTTKPYSALTNKINQSDGIKNITIQSTNSVSPNTQQTLTDKFNISAVEGTVMFENLPVEVGVGGKSTLFYKGFMVIVCLITVILLILVIAYGARYRKSKKLLQREKQRQLNEKCKDSVPMSAVMSDMASESKRSDSGISYGTEVEPSVDCNTMDYKQRYPDLIISQDKIIRDDKKEEPIYMSLNNCSDEESEIEEIIENNNPVYMKLDREAEILEEVYSSIEIGKSILSGIQNPRENSTEIHKHLYAVLENDSDNNCVVSDLRESDICNSGYYSGESPCEYEELPDALPFRKNLPQPPCAYAVTDLREESRPLRPSVKQTLWRRLTGNSNTMKESREHISRRSLPKSSRNNITRTDSLHNPLTKTNSCPLVVPAGVERSRTPITDSLKQLRNAHFMANRPLVSRPIFGRTLSTEKGIVVTDDYAELELNPSYSKIQTDDTYESLDEYTVVKSPAKNKLHDSTESKISLKASLSFNGKELPKLKKSMSCRCGSPNTDRGFFSSSSEEEVADNRPETPPRILKNYKREDKIRKDEARLKRASWPNRMPNQTEKSLNKLFAYSDVQID